MCSSSYVRFYRGNLENARPCEKIKRQILGLILNEECGRMGMWGVCFILGI